MIGLLKRMIPRPVAGHLKRHLFAVNDMTSRLLNLRRAGFHCTGAVDGGAYEGEWSKTFWRAFPGIPTLLIEPLPHKAAHLRELAAARSSYFAPNALGRQAGTARFELGETNSHVATAQSDRNVVEVPMATLDQLLNGSPAFEPNLLKLDLQGYELEALQGCEDLASRFEVIILEVSVIRIGDVPIFREVDAFLAQHDYVLYDIIPQYYRPLDHALWQCDAFYVRAASSLVSSREWA